MALGGGITPSSAIKESKSNSIQWYLKTQYMHVSAEMELLSTQLENIWYEGQI